MPNGKTDTLRTNLPTIARLGARVFVANVLPVTAAGEPVRDTDIQPQTHAAFQRLRDALAAAGVELADLVRINTYY
ncbi:MAG TPA: Rid family hydrolase, partial [Burkholderiaceae bacterium]|nr:Rid family hydrolase [Burkholderiaceae bacterium]